MKRFFLIILTSLFILPCSFSYAAERYELIDLGSSVAAESSQAYAINNEGIVVGYFDYKDGGWLVQRAVQWVNQVAEILPLFHDPTTTYGTARAINDHNEIAGAMDGNGERPMGCIWHPDGSLDMVGTGWVVDMNNNSEAIGFSLYATESYLMRDGQWHLIISEELNGIDVSFPKAINDLTQIVGTGLVYAAHHQTEFPFLWEDGNLINLNGILNNYQSEIMRLNSAVDINNLGQIIGEMEVNLRWLPRPIKVAYILDNGTLEAVGFFRAEAINDLGQIVGSHYLYEDGDAFNLYDLIDTPIVYDDLDVVDINNSGQIVGSALIDGSAHAVLLNPVPGALPPLTPPNLRIIP